MSEFTGGQVWWRGRLGKFGPAVAAYLFATLLTDASFMADTADYVDSVVATDAGLDYKFWEFGHLFWRPLAWLVFYPTKPLLALFTGSDVRTGAALVLVSLNWLAGLLCVVLLVDLLNRVTGRAWAAHLATLAFIFTQGFLNFAQTGSPYITGLAFLLLGLKLSIKGAEEKEPSWRMAVSTGLALAFAVLMWFLYVWTIPAAIAAPLLLFGYDRRKAGFALRAFAAFALFTLLAYAFVLAHMGVYSMEGVRLWVADSSHGNQVSGATRVVFGLVRSFINMGNDGMLFKRYLLSDPFNTVTVWELFRLSVWKVLLFYLFLFSLAVGLWRAARGVRVSLLVALACAPVIFFALFFDGGAVERYIPIYPFVFLGLAVLLASERVRRPLKYVALVFVAAAVISNTQALSKTALKRQQDRAAARIAGLVPLLKPQSVVYVANWQDDLMNFSRSFPFHTVNRRGALQMDALVTPGTAHAAEWREDFAARALKVWNDGGDVWVSARVLSERPRPEWNWVEGDERSVSWPDFKRFFLLLEMSDNMGVEDGFVLLAQTRENENLLRPLAQKVDLNRAGR